MLSKYYYRLHARVRTQSPRLYETLFKNKKIIKYVFSGGMATLTNLAVLYLFTHFFQVYYLASSAIAFLVSIAVSFGLQKFWTFEDAARDGVHTQFALYSLVVFGNFFLNTFLVYSLVTWFSVWYLAAQLLAGVAVAISGFFAYRRFVFKR